MSKASARCAWRIYVYELPGSYRRATHDVSARRGVRLPTFLPGLDARLFAPSQFASGEIYFERSLQHPCRTWNASEATLFFVPVFDSDRHGAKERVLWCAERAPWERRTRSVEARNAFFGAQNAFCVSAEQVLISKRMSSSHAYGGYSKVYSGSILRPSIFVNKATFFSGIGNENGIGVHHGSS